MNKDFRRELHEQVEEGYPAADEVLEKLVAVDPWWAAR